MSATEQAPGAPAAAREHEGVTGVVFRSDGHLLLGTLYLARGREPKPTALLLHGCPGIEKNMDIAADLRDRGWNAFIFHYRGCWGSEGRYDLRTINSDVVSALDYLERSEYPSIDAGRIAVVGHSLGGWAAILTAAADQRVRAVAVLGAPASLDVVNLGAAELDREFIRFIASSGEEFLAQRAEVGRRPGPLQLVGSISPRPLLIIHGSEDAWVPMEHARLLHRHARQPCRFIQMDGANHSFAWHRGELRDLLARWLAETCV